MTKHKSEKSTTKVKLEDILRVNKKIPYLLKVIDEAEQNNYLMNICGIIEEQRLDLEMASNVLYLQIYAPHYVSEILDIAKKIEYIADEKRTNFKDVVFSALKQAGVENLKYHQENLDFAYLENAIYIIGGLKCSENHDYFCKLAKENQITPGDASCKDLIYFYGLERMKDLLGINDDVSVEVRRELVPKMPRCGFPNLELDRVDDLHLPKKL